MNINQLAKNIGATYRLRPLPIRIDATGTLLGSVDDQWRLNRVDRAARTVELTNTASGHSFAAGADNLQEFRTPDFLMLRCQITLTPTGLSFEPLQKGSYASPGSTPAQIPRSRYQLEPHLSSIRHIPFRPENCDGCTAAVQFRPITRIVLAGLNGGPQTAEQFCPSCARDRGVVFAPPSGMTTESLYAPNNPTLVDVARSAMIRFGLANMKRDPELSALGVTSIGMSSTIRTLTITVMQRNLQLRVHIPFEQLQQSEIVGEGQIVAYIKGTVLRSLRR